VPKGRFRAPRRGGSRIGVEALLVEKEDAGAKGEEHQAEAGGDAEIVANSADLKEGPTSGRAFRLIGESEGGYLVELEVAVAAWALAASWGTTPSCCISPRASQLT
jgi:hypothetical protein